MSSIYERYRISGNDTVRHRPTMTLQTCKTLNLATRARSLWLGLLRHQQTHLPLPIGARSTDDTQALTQNQLEHIVRSSHITSMRWLDTRPEHPFRPRPSRLGESIILFEIFLERYLVCIYAEGVISVWDLGSPFNRDTRALWLGAIKPAESLSWSSAAAAGDDDVSVFVAVTKAGG